MSQLSNKTSRLKFAVLSGDQEKVRASISEGDDPDTCIPFSHWKSVPVLCVASGMGYNEVVLVLLEAGANTEYRGDYIWSALYEAASLGHSTIVETLLDNGADMVSIYKSDGSLPIHRAVWDNRIQVVQLLLDWGSPLDPLDKKEKTPLHIAARHGHQAIAELLVQRGAGVSNVDAYGKTAADVAKRYGQIELAAYLHSCQQQSPALTGTAPTNPGFMDHCAHALNSEEKNHKNEELEPPSDKQEQFPKKQRENLSLIQPPEKKYLPEIQNLEQQLKMEKALRKIKECKLYNFEKQRHIESNIEQNSKMLLPCTNDLGIEKEELRIQLEEKSSQFTDLNQQLQKGQEIQNSVSNQMNLLRSESDELQNKLEKLQRESTELNKISSTRISDLEKEKSELRSLLEETKSQLKALQQQQQISSTRISDLENEKSELRSLLEETKSQLKALQQQQQTIDGHSEGTIFLFNYVDFLDSRNKRNGAERDSDNIMKSFSKLGYKIYTHTNYTFEETLAKFEEIQKDCTLANLIIMILSHGTNRYSFMTSDERNIDLDKLRRMFTNSACPSLKGKSKIFMANFCRGDRIEHVHDACVTPSSYEPPHNMVTIHAATEGIKAVRDQKKGSIFVLSLCKIINEQPELELREIFNELYRQMNEAGGTTPMWEGFPPIDEFYF